MPSLKSLDILLVEDREEDAELALLALHDQDKNNSIEWVRDGQAAIDFLHKTNLHQDHLLPRVILLDQKMPKMSGVEVLRVIRSHPRTATIPVIMLTTSQETQDRIQAYEAGVNSYILKPVGFDSFMETIGEVGKYWLKLNESPAEFS